MYTNELKAVDIRADFDFLLPLDHGQRIVAFKRDDYENVTLMSCCDPRGRLIGSEFLERHVEQERVAQCGLSKFVVCHDSDSSDSAELSVYDSDLNCLRNGDCKNFSAICCNCKFVFGLWDTNSLYEPYELDSDDDDDSDEQEAQYSSQRIQVRHLDTLSKAYSLRVPRRFNIERIMADEDHLVAMSLESERYRPWFMTLFNLATCNESSCGGKTVRKYFLPERHVRFDVEALCLASVFLFDGWLVVPREDHNEFVWFDKKGKQNETSTEWNSKKLNEIFSFGTSLLFAKDDGKLLLKQ